MTHTPRTQDPSGSDEAFVALLREQYRALPGPGRISPVAAVERARRRRLSRRLLVAAPTAALALAFALAWNPSGGSRGSEITATPATGSTSASPTEPSGAGTPDATQLNALTERIVNVVGNDPAFGFNSLRLDPQNGVVTIWRVGPAPELDKQIRSIAEGAGARLVLEPAQFTRQELLTAAKRLIERNDSWRPLGFTVIGAGTRPAGLVVSISGDLRAARDHLAGVREVADVRADKAVTGPAVVPNSELTSGPGGPSVP